MRELRLAKRVAVVTLALAMPLGLMLTASPAGAAKAKAPVTVITKFKGTYTGNLGLLMVGAAGQSATTVTITSIHGTGPSTKLGTSTINGSVPAASAASQCTTFTAKGTVASPKGKLIVVVKASPKQSACASGTSTPTSVAVKGVATVTSGTGVYAHTTGTLTFTASFNVSSNTAGSSESDAFHATLAGTLRTKK